jgi:glutamate 5-kinase
MSFKIHSATHAARAGCTTVIALGREPGTLKRVLDAEPVGTRFVAIKDGAQSARDRNAPTVPHGKGAILTQPPKTDSNP